MFNLQYGDCDMTKCLLYSLLSATLMCIFLTILSVFLYKKLTIYAQETYGLGSTNTNK